MRKTIIVGHSLITAVRSAYQKLKASDGVSNEVDFIFLRSKEFALSRNQLQSVASRIDGVNKSAVRQAIQCTGADDALLYLNGNAHNSQGLLKGISVSHERKLFNLSKGVETTLREWLDFLLPLLPKKISHLLPPPPMEDEIEILQLFANLNDSRFIGLEIEPSDFRFELWREHCLAISSVCKEFDIQVIDLPKSVLNDKGFLSNDCWGTDPTHTNIEYGLRVFHHYLNKVSTQSTDLRRTENYASTSAEQHPYKTFPDHSFWKQSISEVPAGDVDPVTSPRFLINVNDKVATAGSCFAQHISKQLRSGGFHFLVTEQPSSEDTVKYSRGFYDFSARYGNVYTARQLLQLFDRAFGYFQPLEQVWTRSDGGFCDPFRPRIEPGGFANEEDVINDTEKHLEAVCRMFRELDVFVFTLGLTECWLSRLDGAVYPLAPGVAGGQYDPNIHEFVNFSVDDVVTDLELFMQKLKIVNPRGKVLLTVSPVPLVATATDQHVLQATTYSKSVLRVAAEEIVASHDNVYYFPSYEIITGPHAEGGYFGSDRRSVTEKGVDHVMRIFMRRMTKQNNYASDQSIQVVIDDKAQEMEELAEALCDEETLAC
jgi:hypothetical protein